jgi:hypothetical protein
MCEVVGNMRDTWKQSKIGLSGFQFIAEIGHQSFTSCICYQPRSGGSKKPANSNYSSRLPATPATPIRRPLFYIICSHVSQHIPAKKI